ncbi:hypothetical protein CXB51_022887 [Gossypium anomalum]|uniref:Uncharacterized protein n=1 Tax=Gossypium anomalum TaxID=47600 RepID=A0A8J5Y931_9ROSI|nr:hypothetical protein CXB51_022887 [Gossypium anomalum]
MSTMCTALNYILMMCLGSFPKARREMLIICWRDSLRKLAMQLEMLPSRSAREMLLWRECRHMFIRKGKFSMNW